MQVIVLGATRSGTSVTAGLLARLGVNMGWDLRPADIRNPWGYFEDREFLDLNRRILAEAGGNSVRPPRRRDILNQRDRFEDEIADIVRRRDLSSAAWGWKTTTTCLTLELFLPHLTQPRAVVILRNPLAVARSQVAFSSGQLQHLDALRLVASYITRLLETIERNPRIPVAYLSYEELVEKPQETAERLATFLELPISADQARWAGRLVRDRRQRSIARARLALGAWTSLQLARLRTAQRVLAEGGVRALADVLAKPFRKHWRRGSDNPGRR